ncbi:hypothetical protein [Nocardia sp. bgisy134]|uniref:hypothetical protein n=1 Tax=Nocardia sp. bgisy134 TaxID=3413789 RepID=UPI003D702595
MSGLKPIELALINSKTEFHAALRELKARSGLSYDQILERVKDGSPTRGALHNWVNGVSWPSWRLLGPVLQTLVELDAPGSWAKTGADWQAAYRRTSQVIPHLRPLTEVNDPFELEVRRSITTTRAFAGELPVYVLRKHDDELDEVVGRAIAGCNEMAVLLGGSSTGKTRAIWEALRRLRGHRRWRLWHPLDRNAFLSELPNLQPRTVVWLNEAQRYLDTRDGDTGEPVAVELRKLLRGTGLKPVLILATLWPKHYEILSSDKHPQAHQLLEERLIRVADAFTGEDLEELDRLAGDDPRLAEAREKAVSGRIIQYLAGAPELLRRYEYGTESVQGIIEIAMDARRLGHSNCISIGLLRDASPDYIAVGALDDEWLTRDLEELRKPARGLPGPLTPIPPRRTGSRRRGHLSANDAGPRYELAEYLDQHGRIHRADCIPPTGFWDAVADHACAADLTALGHAAWERGLYRDAAQLWKTATEGGDPMASIRLIEELSNLHPGDTRPEEWIKELHRSTDHRSRMPEIPQEICSKRASLQRIGNKISELTLANTDAVASLMKALSRGGMGDQLSVLSNRVATETSPIPAPRLATIIDALRQTGQTVQLALLARRVVECHPPWKPDREERSEPAYDLLHMVENSPFLQLSEVMSITQPARAVRAVCDALRRAEQVTAANAIVDHITSPAGGNLLAAADHLEHKTSDFYPRHDNNDDLIEVLGRIESGEISRTGIDMLIHFPVDVVGILDSAQRFDEYTGDVISLVQRAPLEVKVDRPEIAAELLTTLRDVATPDRLTALADRIAEQTNLSSPVGVSELLHALHMAGQCQQLSTVAERAARSVTDLTSWEGAVERLLKQFLVLGEDQPYRVLVARLPAWGLIDLFMAQSDHWARYRFGREPDGSIAAPWGWDDLH